ncbi:HAMP domain-containing histidine kinase [Candidatus Parcubacteria bacterium]|nr:HAMP domain-containing histidine kinase [Candidatus Parcubacteria bacterium]
MEEIRRRVGKNPFGIQWKLAVLLLFIGFFVVAIAISGIVGLRQVGNVSSLVTEKEVPLMRAIEEALSAMTVGQSLAERALDIEDPALYEELTSSERGFNDSVTRFSMFMSAITWGSETEAFRRSANGANYKAWEFLGLRGTLVIKEPTVDEAQLAGEASIYYEGFVNNTRRAFEARKDYITLLGENKNAAAQAARAESRASIAKARHFTELAVNDLREMVRRSSDSTATSAHLLQQTEQEVQRTVLAVSIIGLIISFVMSVFFARRAIVTPITKLAAVASEFGEGKLETRVELKTGDEIEQLGDIFNKMADHLGRYTASLEEEVGKRTEELRQKVSELDSSNQLLIKRESELTLVNDRLLELDKAKSEFISVAAHQLRTPLSAIKWTLSLLIDEQSENLDAEQKSLLMKGYESNERIIALINEMLVVTRIEAGKVQYNFSMVHIEDIIDSILLDFAGQSHVRKIKMSFERPSQDLPYLHADPEKLRTVLQNLTENAVKYTHDGGSITLFASVEEGMVKIGVKDTGIGIPTRQQSSIFNKFFRADNAAKQETDGSGLGLFIAKSIVEKHSGKIWFESAEGIGSTFYFTMPAATRDEMAASAQAAKSAPVAVPA